MDDEERRKTRRAALAGDEAALERLVGQPVVGESRLRTAFVKMRKNVAGVTVDSMDDGDDHLWFCFRAAVRELLTECGVGVGVE